MAQSLCIERAYNMSGPHWGQSPLAAGSSNGSWRGGHMNANASNPPFMFHTSRLNGFRCDNATWNDTCGSSWQIVPGELVQGVTPSAIVVNITDMINSNTERPFFCAISNCNGSVAFNTTKPGVFVVPGSSAVVFTERWYGAGNNNLTACPGQAYVSFTSAPLEDVCKADTTLAECNAANPPTGTSVGSATKQSFVVSTVAILSTLVAALF